MINNRFGAFRIPHRLLDNDTDLVLLILKDMIVVRAELRYDTIAIHYIAMGKMFDENDGAEPTPDYTYEVDTLMGSVTWTRSKEVW